jgi:hypothetical protein
LENLNRKDQLEELGACGRIILKYRLRRRNGRFLEPVFPGTAGVEVRGIYEKV